MSQQITTAHVVALARVAGITLTESEQGALAPQIQGICEAVRKLSCPRETEPMLMFNVGRGAVTR